jgi:hypothetical protein
MLDNRGYRNTLRICNTSCFSTATVVVRKHLNLTVHVVCLSCCLQNVVLDWPACDTVIGFYFYFLFVVEFSSDFSLLLLSWIRWRWYLFRHAVVVTTDTIALFAIFMIIQIPSYLFRWGANRGEMWGWRFSQRCASGWQCSVLWHCEGVGVGDGQTVICLLKDRSCSFSRIEQDVTRLWVAL